ncbi:unnamed protein product, partial [marine sediment metagenome]
ERTGAAQTGMNARQKKVLADRAAARIASRENLEHTTGARADYGTARGAEAGARHDASIAGAGERQDTANKAAMDRLLVQNDNIIARDAQRRNVKKQAALAAHQDAVAQNMNAMRFAKGGGELDQREMAMALLHAAGNSAAAVEQMLGDDPDNKETNPFLWNKAGPRLEGEAALMMNGPGEVVEAIVAEEAEQDPLEDSQLKSMARS